MHAGPPVSSDRELRKSAVDNLERLYTIVAGLSLTTAVGRLIRESPGPSAEVRAGSDAFVRVANVDLYANVLPMFVTLVVTLIPFYHGANRYLYSSYVFNNDLPRPLTAIVDFVFFFSQALLFYAMALVLGEALWFYWLFTALLALDCLWLIQVYFRGEDFEKVRFWLWLNLASSTIMFVILVTPLLPEDMRKWILASLLSVARSVADYGVQWSFYWPGFAAKGSAEGFASGRPAGLHSPEHGGQSPDAAR